MLSLCIFFCNYCSSILIVSFSKRRESKKQQEQQIIDRVEPWNEGVYIFCIHKNHLFPVFSESERFPVASVLPALYLLLELLKETPTTKTCSCKKRMNDKLLIHRNWNFKTKMGVNQWRSRLQLIMWSTSHVGDNASTVEEQNFACVSKAKS